MIAPVPTRSGSDSRLVAWAFGAVLRAARETAGMTQEVLAERADCDRTYPSLLERGLRQPTIGMMIDIAGALRVEPAALVNLTIARLRERGAKTWHRTFRSWHQGRRPSSGRCLSQQRSGWLARLLRRIDCARETTHSARKKECREGPLVYRVHLQTAQRE